MQLAVLSPRMPPGDDAPQFERLIANLSSRLASLQLDDRPTTLGPLLEEICLTLGLDRSSVLELGDDGIQAVHTRSRSGASSLSNPADLQRCDWLTRQMKGGLTVAAARLEDLPIDAQAEREYARHAGLHALLAVPMSIGDRCLGAVVLWSASRGHEWTSSLQHRARLLAEIIGTALRRSWQDAALHASLQEIERLNGRLAADNVCLKEDIKKFHDFDEIVGESDVMVGALERLSQVAPLSCSVLLLGETGTGKELFARAVHERSRRRSRALVRVNCAALPPSLIESELFGHEKGAFTGAVGMRQGRFEMADGGTLFLDEIGDLPLDMQGKLLRVLQEGEFERVGSSRTRKVDVRLIAATHHDLESAMAEGTFRADLYYRLSVFPIHVPALRERRQDIPSLVWFFIHNHQHELGRHVTKVPAHVMTTLASHDWPGNVRELENVVERALIRSPGDTLQLDASFGERTRDRVSVVGGTLDSVQRAHIEQTLRQCGWRINGAGNAAERLGLHPNTLRFRMKKLGIVTHRPPRGMGSLDS
jgi:formate hydrogenlyase transcriptional activator